MRTLMFHSYKGGSGRTVAAANVATALAKMGKRTAIIDLDFEAPGLQYVLGATKTEQYQSGKGIQHFLKGEIDLAEVNTDVAIDMFGEDGPLGHIDVPKSSMLLYVMASAKVKDVNFQDPQTERRLQRLLDMLRDKRNVELVIIDAASGLGPQ